MPLERFNFDIVIVIITAFCMIFGFYYSLRREIKKAVNLILSVAITRFSSTIIVRKILLSEKYKNSLYKVYLEIIKFLKIENKFEIHFFFVILIIEIILVYNLLRLILKLFDKRAINKVLDKEEITSRLVASLIALVQAYIYSVGMLVFMGGIIKIDYRTPLTSFVQETSANISLVSGYNKVKVLCEEKEIMSEELSIIYGENVLDIYNEIVNDNSNDEIVNFKLNLQRDVNDYSVKELLDLYCDYFSNQNNKNFHMRNIFINIENIRLFYEVKKIADSTFNLNISDDNINEFCLKLKELEKNNEAFYIFLRDVSKEANFEVLNQYLTKIRYLEDGEDELIDKIFNSTQKLIEKISKKNILVRLYINKTYSFE